MRIIHLIKAYKVKKAYRKKQKEQAKKLAKDIEIIDRINKKLIEVRNEYLEHQRENPHSQMNAVYYSKITLLKDLLK